MNIILSPRQIAASLTGDTMPCPACGEIRMHGYARGQKPGDGLYIGGIWVECRTCGRGATRQGWASENVPWARHSPIAGDSLLTAWNDLRNHYFDDGTLILNPIHELWAIQHRPIKRSALP